MSSPKVTIVIPVYNVEPYLRQCLDSIVNQTLREIQIICVNDGSTDGSFGILQEYAAKDSRIEIIDKPNGGLSSARNAAYPHLKGKYTLFVDSDDWIDLDTCRKTYYRAEQAGADVVVFEWTLLDADLKTICQTQWSVLKETCSITDKKELLAGLQGSMVDKLYRTTFILDNDIKCPVGLMCEDQFVAWQTVLLSEKIVCIPIALYYYRSARADSTMNRKSSRILLDLIQVFRLIRDFLESSGEYVNYREVYHLSKLYHIRNCYRKIMDISGMPDITISIKNALDDCDVTFLNEDNNLSSDIKSFYFTLLFSDKTNYDMVAILKRINRLLLRPIVKRIEMVIRTLRGKRIGKKNADPNLHIIQLSETVTQLCEEIVQLRETIDFMANKNTDAIRNPVSGV
ncbi:MAG: glycosyltransferase family 2 protein [Thermoguttaceae bacterium]